MARKGNVQWEVSCENAHIDNSRQWQTITYYKTFFALREDGSLVAKLQILETAGGRALHDYGWKLSEVKPAANILERLKQSGFR